jgi:predicted HTH domain antitoxin
MTQMLEMRIAVPVDDPEEAIRLAQSQAKEAAVLLLQQEGRLTIREAAAELDLTYTQYLDLLAERSLPASHDVTEVTLLDRLRHELGVSDSRGS